MTEQDVTIIMPTKGRPDLVAKVLLQVPHRPFILAIDKDSQSDLPEYLHGASITRGPQNGVGPIPALEQAIVETDTSHFVVICDDVVFPDGGVVWVEEACAAYNEAFSDGHGVLALNDGYRDDMACFFFTSKQFYEKHIYPSPYHRYYLDTEISEKAKHLGVFRVAKKARVTHLILPSPGIDSGAVMQRECPLFQSRMDAFKKGNQ